MNHDFSYLVCGNPQSGSELGEILLHIGSNLDTVMSELINLLKLDDKKLSLYGPFIGRSILELSCTAIISRIDPFRALVLREVQKQSNYQISTR